VTTAESNTIVGAGVDRVDGPLKVTGAAPYPSDVSFDGLAHAALVQSTIGTGTISRIDTEDAEASPGVLAVVTHKNAPPLADGPMTPLGPSPPTPFRDNRILHHGQHVAIVVAQTPEQATAAARSVRIEYQQSTPILGIENPDAAVLQNPWGLELQRGDVEAALASAEVLYDETFAIAAETNNPMGLFGTVARWEENRLTVHDCNQWPVMVRQTLATVFDLPETDVRVLVPYLGGGFGAGLRAWPHVILAALASRLVQRPVKLVLTRPQMFTSIGHRAQSRQRVRLGSKTDGRLVAIDHEGTSTLAIEDFNIDPITMATGSAYACPNVATHDRLVRLNISSPGAMRAPGKAEGNFAIESALDELSYELAIDPIELRLANYAEVHPHSALPWSSNALQDCYRVGAERFGWARRDPAIGSIREGNWLLGYGMAGVTFGSYQAPCQVRITLKRDATAVVRSTATDIGTGTYTIATQLTAELLGLQIAQVTTEIGDSDLPPAAQSGGSGLAMSHSAAIHDAAGNLLQALLALVSDDEQSPLRGRGSADVACADGRVHLVDDPAARESFAEILARHDLDEITADGRADLETGRGDSATSAFAAQFVEVRIDKDLGLLRIARVVSAIDAGRILNHKTARSQIIGGVVMGIGMATLEETIFDSATGRIANATLGDYLIPVNADVPDIDVVFVGEPDSFSPVGIKGLGEIGIVGAAAAVANAVYHATGRRFRSLPITIDQLL
jgi:xanthine dehydrogenase YagR molybdenum-binding subunit